MEDFKKNSLIENYNRIVRARNQRLNERGGYIRIEANGEPATGDDVVNKDNLVDYIIQYEGGELDNNGTIQLFAYLIKTGQAWSLQGHYGRTAKAIIDAGYVDKQGNILRDADSGEDEL